MNTGVVHDGVYSSYLLKLELLDKDWRLPKRVEDNLALAWMAVSMFTILMGKYLSEFVWIPVLIAEFILFASYAYYARRLNGYYRSVSKTYLRALIPDACKVFSSDDMVVYGKTKLLINAGGVTYHCGLRTLAQTKGLQGWQVEFKQSPLGSFADMQAWVDARPQSSQS